MKNKHIISITYMHDETLISTSHREKKYLVENPL